MTRARIATRGWPVPACTLSCVTPPGRRTWVLDEGCGPSASVSTASAGTRRAQANPQPPRQSRGGHHRPEGEHDEPHTLSVRPLSRHRGTALTHAPEEDKPFICAIPPLERPRGVQLIQRRALTEAPSVSFRNSPIFTASMGVQLTPGDELTENPRVALKDDVVTPHHFLFAVPPTLAPSNAPGRAVGLDSACSTMRYSRRRLLCEERGVLCV